MCRKRKGAEVEKADIRKVYGLFQDQGRSTQFLKGYHSLFLFDEAPEDQGEEEEEEGAAEEGADGDAPMEPAE